MAEARRDTVTVSVDENVCILTLSTKEAADLMGLLNSNRINDVFHEAWDENGRFGRTGKDIYYALRQANVRATPPLTFEETS